MNKHIGVKFLGVMAVGALLAGCASGGGGGATTAPSEEAAAIVKGGNAVIALNNDTGAAFDPVQSSGQANRQVMDPFCERLYEEQGDGSVAPMLATELPKVSEDGLTLTLPLREGAVFNDGTPFNADAVKFNLDRAVSDPLSVRKVAKEYIKSVEVVDESTVEITLTRKYSPILSELTDFTGMMASPTAVEKGGFSDNPVCVGPFEWSSRTPGDNTVLTKSDVYYDKDKVNLDSVTFKIVQDFSAKENNIQSGDLQYGTVTDAFYSRMKESDQVHVHQDVRPGGTGFLFNVGNVAGVGEPYGDADNVMAKNPELREAFALAIDTKALTAAMQGADAPEGCSPIPASSAFASDITCTPFDLDKAKELIKKSGVPTPIKLKFTVPTYSWVATGAEVIQAMVKKAGFDVEIVTQEGNSVFQDMRAGNFELAIMPMATTIADPSSVMTFETGNPDNWPGYSTPELDKLISDARETYDVKERTALYQKAIEEYNKAYAYVYTGGLVTQWATSGNFATPQGGTPGGNVYLKTAGFTELP